MHSTPVLIHAMIQNLLVLGINKYYGILFPYCITFLLGKNKNSYFLKLHVFIHVYSGGGGEDQCHSTMLWRSEENPRESVLLRPMSSGFYVRLLNLMVSNFTTWVVLPAQSFYHKGHLCVFGLAQPGILIWGNGHPKHYNGMRQMGAAIYI